MRITPRAPRGRVTWGVGLAVAAIGWWSYVTPEISDVKRQTIAYWLAVASPNFWGAVMVILGGAAAVAVYFPGSRAKKVALAALTTFCWLWVVGILATVIEYEPTPSTAGTAAVWAGFWWVLHVAADLPAEDDRAAASV